MRYFFHFNICYLLLFVFVTYFNALFSVAGDNAEDIAFAGSEERSKTRSMEEKPSLLRKIKSALFG